jgi:hypothetical protein
MDLVVATEAAKVPKDFYAAAVAACVVIVFAKFATHNQRRRSVGLQGLKRVVGPLGHWLCVGFAWVGLALSLLMLGEKWLSGEEWIRWVVGGLAVVAGAILSLDTALPSKGMAAATQPDGQAVDAESSADKSGSGSTVEFPR